MDTSRSGSDILGMPVEVFAAWGQWVGGIGAVLAVVVALWLALRDGRRYEAERKDAQAAQARTIIATVRWTPEGPPEDGHGRREITVENLGTLPVTAVEVVSVTYLPQLWKEYTQWRTDPPPYTGSLLMSSPGRVCKVLRPGEVATLPLGGFLDLSPRASLSTDEDRYTVVCTFLDANGIRWQREGAWAPKREHAERRQRGLRRRHRRH